MLVGGFRLCIIFSRVCVGGDDHSDKGGSLGAAG